MEKKTNSKPRGDSAFLRFFRPSMRLYFCILVLFAVLTLACRHWELGIIEVLAAALLLLYSRFIHKRQERKVLDYLGASVQQETEGNGNTIPSMPLPMVISNRCRRSPVISRKPSLPQSIVPSFMLKTTMGSGMLGMALPPTSVS